MKLKKPSKAKLRKGEEIAGGGIGIENYNPKRFKKCGSLKKINGDCL